MTWVHGRTVHRLIEPAMASEAGRLVARWHRATEDLERTFSHIRPGAHDTEAHVTRLREALETWPAHRLHPQVAALADGLLAAWQMWEGDLEGAARVVHGDLKISNLLFDPAGGGLCLLDFDTLSMQPLEVELGDAARSWCNPRGEDVEEAELDVDLFDAAFSSYLQEHALPADGRRAIVATLERICLELSARFAADALSESYFGWDPRVAPTRGDHNLLRARGQASLARSVARRRLELERSLGLR
jgi:Ser/Thr protein kinase RdoA (MazF antagonist)